MAGPIPRSMHLARLREVRGMLDVPTITIAAQRMEISRGALCSWLQSVCGSGAWPPPASRVEAAIERIGAGGPIGWPPQAPQPASALDPARADEGERRHLASEAEWLEAEKPGLNGRKALPLSEQVL